MKSDDVAAIVLAAGLSRRFGSDDKLLASLCGKPLAAYAAAAVTKAGFGRRYAVLPADAPALEKVFCDQGFAILANPHPDAGQGSSLAIGVKAAIAAGAKAALIVLADMPFVTPDLLIRLCDGSVDADAAISFDGERRSPPACFSASAFEALATLEGDAGAKALLGRLGKVAVISAATGQLTDIDAPEDLLWAESRLRSD